MAERARHWIKLWVAWLTTPAHVELSGGALGLGPLLLLLATWDGEYDSGGWLLAEDGSPISREALARATHRTRQQLDRELAELVKCRTLTVRDDGAVGFARYGHWQETSQATRTRRYRERHRDAPCDARGDGDVRAQFVICDAQTEDGRREINKPPLTPPAEGESAAPATPSKPKRQRKPPAKLPLEVVVVLDRIDEHRLRLGLRPLWPSQRVATHIAARLREGVPLDVLCHAVDARAADVEAHPEHARWFDATSPFTGPSASGRPGGWSVSCSLLEDWSRRQRRAAVRHEWAPPGGETAAETRARLEGPSQPSSAATGATVAGDVEVPHA